MIIWRVWEGAGFCCTTCRHTADDGTDEPALLSMNLELPESGAEIQGIQEIQEMQGMKGGGGCADAMMNVANCGDESAKNLRDAACGL